MRIILAVALCVLPIVLAGDYSKMWAELEAELKEKMSEADQEGRGGWGEHKGWGDKRQEKNDDKEDESSDWGVKQHKGWGEQKSKGWGEEKRKDSEEQQDSEKETSKSWGQHKSKGWGDNKKKVADDSEEQKDDDQVEGWGKKKFGGWGEQKSKGWGGEKKQVADDSEEEKEDNEVVVGWGKKKFGGWGEQKSKGWGKEEKKDSDDDEENFKEKMREQYLEFKEYLRLKALKANEEKEAKAEILKQMEKVQMKKWLAEKLNQVSAEFEEQKMSFVFNLTEHFLGLCQGESDPRLVLERLATGYFAVPEESIPTTNGSGMPFDNQMGDTIGFFNGSFPQILNDPIFRQRKVETFAAMEAKERVKHVLKGYVHIMCAAAEHLTSFVELVETQVIACKQGLATCNFPISG
ncbi:golgin subfamily A member 6-like protein 24 [Biomphalaria glabrata]|uniref:Golgin subfamily A member 6-like protein 24 n=1 Tax=Biomphalaria glabrata TaxID=6526 RepID=A0A9W2YPS4_BIOGL|nr:golgin subfamily A member 6-like protein 24 [Biomphalaria glabrata]